MVAFDHGGSGVQEGGFRTTSVPVMTKNNKALREEICQVIVSLNDETYEEIESKLAPLLDLISPEEKEEGEGITPILVAADRGNVPCLKILALYDTSIEGHLKDDKIAAIMAELEEQSIMLKPLGSYPQARL